MPPPRRALGSPGRPAGAGPACILVVSSPAPCPPSASLRPSCELHAICPAAAAATHTHTWTPHIAPPATRAQHACQPPRSSPPGRARCRSGPPAPAPAPGTHPAARVMASPPPSLSPSREGFFSRTMTRANTAVANAWSNSCACFQPTPYPSTFRQRYAAAEQPARAITTITCSSSHTTASVRRAPLLACVPLAAGKRGEGTHGQRPQGVQPGSPGDPFVCVWGGGPHRGRKGR